MLLRFIRLNGKMHFLYTHAYRFLEFLNRKMQNYVYRKYRENKKQKKTVYDVYVHIASEKCREGDLCVPHLLSAFLLYIFTIHALSAISMAIPIRPPWEWRTRLMMTECIFCVKTEEKNMTIKYEEYKKCASKSFFNFNLQFFIFNSHFPHCLYFGGGVMSMPCHCCCSSWFSTQNIDGTDRG